MEEVMHFYREEITLIGSTFLSFPIYFMYHFRIPRILRLRMEKIQRDLYWGGGASERKPH